MTTHMAGMNIAVVEDEKKLAESLREGLEAEGYKVSNFYDGQTAEDGLLKKGRYDLAILDLMLPKKDGLTVCKTVRDAGIDTPILVLTARDTLDDKIQVLDGGADDFVAKPFSFEELLARLRALSRRSVSVSGNIPAGAKTKISVADIVLDRQNRTMTRAGKNVPLTFTEFELLEFLMTNLGRVLSRDDIFMHIWKRPDDHSGNVVDVHIRNLRRKIDDKYSRKIVRTVRNVGYSVQE